MLISPVISQLKTYCPTFNQRVAGGLDWDSIQNSAKLALPAAYVVMGEDEADRSTANVVRQALTDYFDVVVVLRNIDERGQNNCDNVHLIRAELFKALIGFIPTEDYEPIQYVNGSLVEINRAISIYQFRFLSQTGIGRTLDSDPPETWEEVEKDGLPLFEEAHINVDVIDPIADPNLKYPGPDGRIEFQVNVKPNKGNKP